MLRPALGAGAAMAALALACAAAPAATASTPGGSNCVPRNGVVTCTAADPGTPGNGGTPTPGGSTSCMFQGQGIPCVVDLAWWSSTHECYAMPAITNGVTLPGPSKMPGAWWACTQDVFGLPMVGGPLWFVPAVKSPIPESGTLAQSALGSLRLVTAEVRTAPSPPHPEIIGIEVWLWVPASQWRVLTKTVAAGGTRVTVTAAPSRVTWDMGDGSEPTICDDAGRPWETSYTDAAQTDCGYTYRSLSAGQPGGVFRITATISYFVTWTCTGACTAESGVLGLVAARGGHGRLQSLQRQTVVVP